MRMLSIEYIKAKDCHLEKTSRTRQAAGRSESWKVGNSDRGRAHRTATGTRPEVVAKEEVGYLQYFRKQGGNRLRLSADTWLRSLS